MSDQQPSSSENNHTITPGTPSGHGSHGSATGLRNAVRTAIEALGPNIEGLEERSFKICSRIQQCSMWSSVLASTDEVNRYLAVCSIFIASRVKSPFNFEGGQNSTTIDRDGIAVDSIMKCQQTQVKLVEFFEILNSCVVTLLLEDTDFNGEIRRAMKKLVAFCSLYDEYEKMFDTLFNYRTESATTDPLFQFGWILFIETKNHIDKWCTDFELLSQVLAVVIEFLAANSPDRIEGNDAADIYRQLGVRKVDVEEQILDLVNKSFGAFFGDAASAAEVLKNPVEALNTIKHGDTSKQLDGVNFDDLIFLSNRALVGNAANLKSAPVYQMNAQRHNTMHPLEQNSLFYSPMRSPTHNSVPVSVLASTLLSITYLKNQLRDEPSEPDQKLLRYLAAGPANLTELVVRRLNETVESIPMPEELTDTAVETRRTLIKKIYYHNLYNSLAAEETRLHQKDFSALLKNDKFNKALIACSIQTLFFVYNYRDVMELHELLKHLNIQAYDFVKVIENFVVNATWMSRIIKRHFRAVEEQVLDCLVWKKDSVLFDYLKRQDTRTILPSQSANAPTMSASMFQSPARPTSAGVPMTPNSKQRMQHATDFLFRKLHRLIALRVQELFKTFTDIDDVNGKMDKVWTIVCNVLSEKYTILTDRHIDHVIMCSMYAICSKMFNLQISFKNIINSFKTICETTRQMSPVEVGKILMQVPLHQEGQIGDIVKFYNRVFIPETKELILNQSPDTQLTMPQLPDIQSPPRKRVSATANVFVSPRRPVGRRSSIIAAHVPQGTASLPAPLPVIAVHGSASTAPIPEPPSTPSKYISEVLQHLTPRTRHLYSFGDFRTTKEAVAADVDTGSTLSQESQERRKRVAKRSLFSNPNVDESTDQNDSDSDEAEPKRPRRDGGDHNGGSSAMTL